MYASLERALDEENKNRTGEEEDGEGATPDARGDSAEGDELHHSHPLRSKFAAVHSKLVSQGTPFLASEEATISDCSAFPFIWRIRDEFGLRAFPCLEGYLARLDELESISKTVNQPYWWWW